KESRQTALATQGPPSRDAKRRGLLAVMTLRDWATSRKETGFQRREDELVGRRWAEAGRGAAGDEQGTIRVDG
ncbi:hypothetical protein PIB30_109080, partial [Stylosanthes scabra]|nr:hypothetical protein [Stylosanthes scabra]